MSVFKNKMKEIDVFYDNEMEFMNIIQEMRMSAFSKADIEECNQILEEASRMGKEHYA